MDVAVLLTLHCSYICIITDCLLFKCEWACMFTGCVSISVSMHVTFSWKHCHDVAKLVCQFDKQNYQHLTVKADGMNQ